ncbi:TetR family transcriptional regulator [Variovorax rhizosphaerae]|uniref:TetR family transcriptional regulator n=1 Tax=Variovorax rhizosphaerae TaxID=1836200 RepID=A0ABU8WXA7_9BURK
MTDRKTAQVRSRELRTALSRVRRGRTRTQVTRLSIAAVAREAGVSAALIHNHYPDIASEIRDAMGRSDGAKKSKGSQELKTLRGRVRQLNQEIRSLRTDVARLASVNEVLIAENSSLKGRVSFANSVTPLASRSRRS